MKADLDRYREEKIDKLKVEEGFFDEKIDMIVDFVIKNPDCDASKKLVADMEKAKNKREEKG